jgi:hypothetical protein
MRARMPKPTHRWTNLCQPRSLLTQPLRTRGRFHLSSGVLIRLSLFLWLILLLDLLLKKRTNGIRQKPWSSKTLRPRPLLSMRPKTWFSETRRLRPLLSTTCFVLGLKILERSLLQIGGDPNREVDGQTWNRRVM